MSWVGYQKVLAKPSLNISSIELTNSDVPHHSMHYMYNIPYKMKYTSAKVYQFCSTCNLFKNALIYKQLKM